MHHAREVKARQENAAVAKRDVLIGQAQSRAKAAIEEDMKWQAACNIAQHLTQDTYAQLLGWGTVADEVVGSLADYWTKWLATKQWQSQHTVSSVRWAVGMLLLIIGIFAFGGIYFSQFPAQGASSETVQLLFWSAGELFVIFVCSPLIVALHYRKSKVISRSLTKLKNQIDDEGKRWISLSEPEHQRRLASIENERQQAMSSIQAQYQRRMGEIAAEHARTLAEIAARYAGG